MKMQVSFFLSRVREGGGHRILMAPVQDKGRCHISERPRLMVAIGVKEIPGAI